MIEIAIAELLADMPVGAASYLDLDRVAYYLRQSVDSIEPIVVFRTPEGLLLADGYHRLAAARRRGASTIACEIRIGSRTEALQYAAAVGAAQRGMKPQQVLAHIQRLSQARPTEEGC
jgi:ParB-like chromosome segregation protein Spo0J